MSKVNCEAVEKRRQEPPGMARAELLHFLLCECLPVIVKLAYVTYVMFRVMQARCRRLQPALLCFLSARNVGAKDRINNYIYAIHS